MKCFSFFLVENLTQHVCFWLLILYLSQKLLLSSSPFKRIFPTYFCFGVVSFKRCDLSQVTEFLLPQFLHSSEGWKSKVKVLAGSGEDPLPGHRLLIVSSHGGRKAVLHSFLLLNNIPLYRYCEFCLSIHKLIIFWLFPLLGNNAVTKICVQLLCGHMVLISFGYISRSRMSKSYNNSHFYLLRR